MEFVSKEPTAAHQPAIQAQQAQQVEVIEESALCNCNDPYKTEVCPVHCKEVKEDLTSKSMVITDANLVSGDIRSWSGYTFTCQKCGADSIMYMMKFCGNCGTPAIIQSQKLTLHINKIQEKMRDGR